MEEYEKEQQAVYLRPDIRADSKKKCIDEKTSLSVVVERLLAGWLKGEYVLPAETA